MFSCVVTDVSADEQIEICRGETLRISASLLMNGTYGDPVPYQVVEFFDETNDCFLESALTDSNGYAFIDWYIPLDYILGYTIVNATFRGNDTYALAPSYQQVSIIILASTYLDVQIEKESFVPGDQMLCKILLTDDNANPLSNESVEVYCTSILLASGKTNDIGQANFVINCNQSWGNLGSNNLTVIYNGNLQKFYASSEHSFSISINKIETTLGTYNQIFQNIALNDSLSFSLFLKTNDSLLTNATVEVILDDKKLTDLMTNESGVADFSIIVDDEFSLGTHMLKFEYTETERYASSVFIIDFTVLSPAIITVDQLTKCVIGEEFIARVYLLDSLSRPIHNVSIKLTDCVTNQSVTQELQSNTNYSDFRLIIQEPKGVRNYNITIIGNDFIYNKTNSFIISVWVQPSISIINSSIDSYASPEQAITFGIRLSDYSSNYSHRSIRVLSNYFLINISLLTNNFGETIINLIVPLEERQCELSIIYEGNESAYELSAYYLYTFHITRIMPVKVEFQPHCVIPSLQQIQLNLKIIAFNGSALEGIELRYVWLNMSGSIISVQNGLIDLRLSVPSREGLYSFVYQTTPSSSVQACSGFVLLSINNQDVLSSQGVGIGSIAVSIVLSLGIVSIPGIMRRRMMGL